jgi:outer membrane protein assembly factor BamB
MCQLVTRSVKILAVWPLLARLIAGFSHRRGRSLVVTLAAASAILAVGLSASPAAAVTTSIALKPSSGPPTSKVTVTGTGFGASETVTVDFSGTQVATATTSSTGTFSTAFNVPKTELPGSYPVTATGQTSGLVATAKFLVRTNWPQFRFNSALAGTNRYENVVSPSNVSGLTRAWTDSVSGAVNVAPAVVNGVVYVPANNGFYAFNASTGALLWSHPGVFFGRSSPAVANGAVYAAGADGNFYAFSTKVSSADCSGKPVTCNPLWTAAIDGASTAAQSSPTVAGGTVFVSAGYNFYAFNASGCDAATCSPLWTAAISPGNGQSPVSGGSTPAVVGGVVYVGGYQGLYAYNANGCGAAACNPLWHGDSSTTGQDNSVGSSSPAVVGGVAYIGAGNNVDAFSTACTSTCQPLWSYVTGGAVNSSPAVANGRVYIGSGDGNLYAFSTAGALLWTATSASDSISPAVANGLVYIGSYHNVYAFSAAGTTGCSGTPKTCAPLWSAPITDTSFASPVIVNGTLYQGEGINGEYLSAFKLP